MDFVKKIHNLSIHSLNVSAVLALTALALNIGSAVCMYLLDRKASKARE